MAHLILTQVEDAEDAVVELWLPDGRTIEVELIDVRPDARRSRIGYTAPADVRVYRRSVANAIRRNGGAAVNAAAAPEPLVPGHVRVPGMAVVAGSIDASGE